MAKPLHALRFPPGIDRGQGTFAQEMNHAEHVEQMMLQVLFTAPGERVNRPDFGCGLAQYVFAPNSDAAADLLKVTIQTALDKWMGSLIRVDDIVTRARDSSLEVRISYLLRARQERRILNLEVTP
jgi:phage baseplate assembly protein W